MNDGVFIGMSRQRGDGAQRPITPVRDVLPEQAGNPVVTSGLFESQVIHLEGHVVFHRTEQPIAQGAQLTRGFDCTVEFHRLVELRRWYFHSVQNGRRARRTADATRVHHRHRKEIFRRIRSRRGEEDIPSLQEKEPFLGEERLQSRKVHDDGIRLHVAKIGQDGCGNLEIAGRPPEHLGAGPEIGLLLHLILGHRGVRDHAPLLARVHAFHLQRPHVLDPLGDGERQGGHAPTLTDRHEATRRKERHAPGARFLRHRQLRPGNEELRRPALLGQRGFSVPDPIPVPIELRLGNESAVGFDAAGRKGHPVPVLAVARRIEHEADEVTEIRPGVPRREHGDDHVARLLQVVARIDATLRVEQHEPGFPTGLFHRVRIDDDEIADHDRLRPGGVVEPAVHADARVIVHPVRDVDDLTGVELGGSGRGAASGLGQTLSGKGEHGHQNQRARLSHSARIRSPHSSSRRSADSDAR